MSIGVRLLAIISIVLFYNINFIFAQSLIGAYCGECKPEEQNLSDAQRQLELAEKFMTLCESFFSEARKKKEKADCDLAFAEERLKNAKHTLNVARLGLRTPTGQFSPIALAVYLTALVVYEEAVAVIPSLKDKAVEANSEYEKASDKYQDALKRVRETKRELQQRSDELQKCRESIRIPNKDLCEECLNERIVPKCLSNEGCCNGECKTTYIFCITVIYIDCNGDESSPNSYGSNNCEGNTTPKPKSQGECEPVIQVNCSSYDPCECNK